MFSSNQKTVLQIYDHCYTCTIAHLWRSVVYNRQKRAEVLTRPKSTFLSFITLWLLSICVREWPRLASEYRAWDGYSTAFFTDLNSKISHNSVYFDSHHRCLCLWQISSTRDAILLFRKWHCKLQYRLKIIWHNNVYFGPQMAKNRNNFDLSNEQAAHWHCYAFQLLIRLSIFNWLTLWNYSRSAWFPKWLE